MQATDIDLLVLSVACVCARACSQSYQMRVKVNAVEDAELCPRDVLLALSKELTRRQSNLGKYAKARGLNIDRRAAMRFLPPNER